MPYLTQDAAGRPLVIAIAGQPGLQGRQGEPGQQGSPGQDGEPGPPGESAAQITRTTATYIPPRRMVVDAGNGRCAVADPTNPDQAGLVLGFVEGNVLSEQDITILQGDLTGYVFDFGFGVPGPLHIADDGSLTRIPRLEGPGFFQVVGWTPDGVSAVIRIGPARRFGSLGGGGVPVPSTADLVLALFGTTPTSPEGLLPGSFYTNAGILERVRGQPDPSIPTTAIAAAMAALFGSLPQMSAILPPGILCLAGRALARTPGSSIPSIPVPAAFQNALGAFWDRLPTSPVGGASGDFYVNGAALERIP